VLGLTYFFLIAKPISIRRLFLLFVLGLMLTPSVLAIFHVKDSPSHALLIATSVVLVAWSLPLVRIVHDTVRLRRLSVDALVPVSDFVRLTYGFALLALPMLTIGCLFDSAHRLMLTVIPPLMAIAALAVPVLHARLDLRRQPKLPLEVSRYQHRAVARRASPRQGVDKCGLRSSTDRDDRLYRNWPLYLTAEDQRP
jgi:hypothetical protein